ncbi:hypothetical protein F443_09979, partial [Phytophthora nicotianae P1569]
MAAAESKASKLNVMDIPKNGAYDGHLLLTPQRLPASSRNGSVQLRPSNLENMKDDPVRQLTAMGIVGLCYFS